MEMKIIEYIINRKVYIKLTKVKALSFITNIKHSEYVNTKNIF